MLQYPKDPKDFFRDDESNAWALEADNYVETWQMDPQSWADLSELKCPRIKKIRVVESKLTEQFLSQYEKTDEDLLTIEIKKMLNFNKQFTCPALCNCGVLNN